MPAACARGEPAPPLEGPAPPPPVAIRTPQENLGNSELRREGPHLGLAAGASHSCALLRGAVFCWGRNNQGQLGLGDRVNRGDAPGQMGKALPPVPLGKGRYALQIAAGGDHTCAVLDDGALKCWGKNSYGQLGLGDIAPRGESPNEMGDNLQAVDVGPGRTVRGVALGRAHTCALLDDGRVKCWGQSLFAQLGLGDTRTRGGRSGEMGARLAAVDLGPGRKAVEVAAGGTHSCARLDDGALKCWGQNTYGQLGLGDTKDRGDQPEDMGENLPVVRFNTTQMGARSVSLGFEHACALLEDRTLKCWGENDSGQLGLEDTVRWGTRAGDMSSLPSVNLGASRSALEVTAGISHTCARLADGALKCWGRNTYGQTGLGALELRGGLPGEMGAALPDVPLGHGRKVVALTAGHHHSCAMLDDGHVKCWGHNTSGQLGLGDTRDRGADAKDMGDALPPVDLSL